MIGLLQDHYFE